MKFMKSIRTVTAVAALCLAATTVAQAQNYKIAFIARAQADSFAAWLANGIMDEVKKYPDMTVDVMDSQADDAKENAFIENSVANKYDLIIVQPNNGEAQRPYVEQAVKDGVKVITTNARIKNIPGSSSVDADPYEQAAVNARLALKQIPQDAKVVVLNGPRATCMPTCAVMLGRRSSSTSALTSRSSASRSRIGTRKKPCATWKTGSRPTTRSTPSSP